MVSGFFTSPCDHDRILSGDAIEMRIELKLRGFFGFSKRLKRSSIIGDCPWISLPYSRLLRSFFDELDVQREALELLHHHVERFGETRLEHVLALDDRLVHASAAGDVVGFDG